MVRLAATSSRRIPCWSWGTSCSSWSSSEARTSTSTWTPAAGSRRWTATMPARPATFRPTATSRTRRRGRRRKTCPACAIPRNKRKKEEKLIVNLKSPRFGLPIQIGTKSTEHKKMSINQILDNRLRQSNILATQNNQNGFSITLYSHKITYDSTNYRAKLLCNF